VETELEEETEEQEFGGEIKTLGEAKDLGIARGTFDLSPSSLLHFFHLFFIK
jgi:hypothetical protein